MILSYVKSQFLITLPKPTKSFAGLTIIVTGANAGLGFEAAKQIALLQAERVILAVRSLERGNAAAETIRQSQPSSSTTILEVWELDMCSYASVRAFAQRADTTLERLDVVIENAGINSHKFELAEDNEKVLTVNFISTMLLGLLLLPKLRETSVKFNKEVVLTFVGTHLHWMAQFHERKSENILAACADEDKTDMKDRYAVSRVMLLMAVRELADQLTKSTNPGIITTSVLSPGSVGTLMARDVRKEGDAPGTSEAIYHWVFDHVLGRKPEEGARTLVWAAYGGRETHGKYLDDCKVAESKTSDFSRSEEGMRTQQRVWDELMLKLETIVPGIANNI
ncbi:putative short-chain dehydrogenase/reductase family protein [Xylariales sp. PMI_506]|nr:putative short-chain dehydrogenase/reductase family protein [Xylariales sp. PMI_506]